jgi:predicted ATPase
LIDKLHIHNFKAFRDQRFDFAPLTLLAGLNGSGKSSLLQSLLVLRQSFDQGLLSQGRVVLNGDLVRLGRFKEALFEGADEERIVLAAESDVGAKYSWSLTFDSKEDRMGSVEAGPTSAERDLSLFGPGFRFLAADRIGPRIHYGVPDVEAASGGLGVRGEWTPHYLALHSDETIANAVCSHPGAMSDSLSHQVEAWMGEVSPGLRIHFDREGTLDLVRLAYSFVARRDTSSQYRPTNVGFGVSYTLPIVTAVLSARPGDLLLLESPEAHLHPHGQAKLGELLSRAAAAGVQLVIESHSDHIMNGVRVAVHQDVLAAERVRFLHFRWNPDDQTGATEVREIRMDTDGRINDWPEGFFDELDHSLEILLTPKTR